MSTTRINNGTITAVKNSSGGLNYFAVSDFEVSPDDHPFLSYAVAAFYLWLVETRVQSRKRRTGEL